jgi:hypothetical protein
LIGHLLWTRTGFTNSPDFEDIETDSSTIADAASTVDQKTGPAPDEVPDQPANTTVTVMDSQPVDNIPVNTTTTTSNDDSRRRRNIPGRFAKRVQDDSANYRQIFDGTGTGPDDRDGSIQGSAYLMYTLINNFTYDVNSFCDSVSGCGMFLSPDFGLLSLILRCP